jgi:hypothetical protein
MKRSYNKKTNIWKFSLSWTMSKIIEFVNRQLKKGAKLIKDYTSEKGKISFALQYS